MVGHDWADHILLPIFEVSNASRTSYLVGPEKVRPGLFQVVASIRRTKSAVFVCSLSARAELRSRQGVHALQVGRRNSHAGKSTRSIDISYN